MGQLGLKNWLAVALRLTTAVSSAAAAENQAFDVFKYVDPFIGTANGGTNHWLLGIKFLIDNCRPCLCRRNAAIRNGKSSS